MRQNGQRNASGQAKADRDVRRPWSATGARSRGSRSSWYRWTMDTTTLSSLADLPDQDLLARVMELAADERRAMALLIAHLAELDARRLYLAEGYSSLFTYCTQALRLSEHAAYGRIEAARIGRKFPVVLEMLDEGAVPLTTVDLLAPHLTAENHRDLLDRVRHKSKRAVEEVIAALYPQPPVPAVVRRLPDARRRPAPTLLDGPPAGPAAAPAPPPGRSANPRSTTSSYAVAPTMCTTPSCTSVSLPWLRSGRRLPATRSGPSLGASSWTTSRPTNCQG